MNSASPLPLAAARARVHGNETATCWYCCKLGVVVVVVLLLWSSHTQVLDDLGQKEGRLSNFVVPDCSTHLVTSTERTPRYTQLATLQRGCTITPAWRWAAGRSVVCLRV